jgi:hypothetical protein
MSHKSSVSKDFILGPMLKVNPTNGGSLIKERRDGPRDLGAARVGRGMAAAIDSVEAVD